MSEFDAFEGADDAQQEEDPAADFLARQQDQLAELGDEEFGFTSSEQPPEDNGLYQNEADAFDLFSGGGTGASDFVMLGESEEPPQNIPGLDDLDERLEGSSGPSDPYASVKQADTQRAEPEKIRIWREQQKERLEKKDREEAEKMLEWREQAKKELDDWYRHREEQQHKTKASNREGEVAFIKERDDTVPGHEWERICRLCEFNPKNSRTTKDVSRMRGILLQLKQNPIVKAH